MITLFNAQVDGYYQVSKVVNPYTIQIKLVLDKQTIKIAGQGLITKFKSRRIESIDVLPSIDLGDALFEQTKVWVDSNESGKWEILTKTPMLTKYMDMSVDGEFSGVTPVGENTVLVSRPGLDKVFGTTVLIASGSEFSVYSLYMDLVATTSIPSGESIVAIASTPESNYVACACSSGRILVYLNKNGIYSLISDFAHGYNMNGATVSISADAGRIIVTSPSHNLDAFNSESGIAVVYDRFVFAVESPYGTSNSQSYQIPFAASNYATCLRNGIDITSNTTFSGNTLTVQATVNTGDVLLVQSNMYAVSQLLQSDDVATKVYSGRKYGACQTGTNELSNVLIGAPFEVTQLNDSFYEGLVHHYHDIGKLNGQVILELLTTTGTCNMYVNGFGVFASLTTADAFVADFTLANIGNVVAEKIDETHVKLSIKNMDLAQKLNALTVTFVDSGNRAKIKYSPYTQVQVLQNPYFTGYVGFGQTILSSDNTFIINSADSKAILRTTFDFIDDGNTQDDTIFDNNFTGWADNQFGRGSAVVYEMEIITRAADINKRRREKVYHHWCKCTNDNVPKRCGSVYSINGDGWKVHDVQSDQVDINRLNATIYNEKEKETVFLDTIDPLNGKFHGVVASNLDFMTAYDPAGYTSKNSSTTWQSTLSAQCGSTHPLRNLWITGMLT
ncbi:LOW QUALITY PROTEIN: hypothetical protein GHT06_001883 [Daphnia sinensis]|uniref:Uncharacterized protein n=1 Tax=Daphnia sinensis TaxID=1820382 RepID=A0AAD5L1Z9_9CRUS|nr:LOW QUALITY PROTEIN: hypothetical protein GHT06_001883 [Daphnia sinensis]